MKNTIKICVLLCSACICIGQAFVNTATFNGAAYLQSMPAAASATSPTNVPGLLAWYISSNYTTNAGMATLPDSWTNGWNLTNVAGSTSPKSGQFGGFKTVWTDGTGSYLRSTAYTSSLPHEVIMFCAWTNNNTSWQAFMDSTSSSYRQYFMAGTMEPGYVRMAQAGSDGDWQVAVTNCWRVWDLVWDYPKARIYTNGVYVGDGSSYNTAISGLTLGILYSTYAPAANVAWLEMLTFSKTNSASDRATLFSYLTNKYGISPQ